MTTSELMKAMADAGAPFEAILIAVTALDAKDAEIARRDADAMAKRAAHAEYKREARANAKAEGQTTGVKKVRRKRVHGQSTDNPETVQGQSIPTPPNDIYSNPPSPSDEGDTREAGSNGSKIKKPDDVSEPVWRDFLTQRRARKAPVTESVMVGIRDEVAKAGWTLEAALTESVARGWQSFKADWVDKAPNPGRPAASNEYLDFRLAKRTRQRASSGQAGAQQPGIRSQRRAATEEHPRQMVAGTIE